MSDPRDIPDAGADPSQGKPAEHVDQDKRRNSPGGNARGDGPGHANGRSGGEEDRRGPRASHPERHRQQGQGYRGQGYRGERNRDRDSHERGRWDNDRNRQRGPRRPYNGERRESFGRDHGSHDEHRGGPHDNRHDGRHGNSRPRFQYSARRFAVELLCDFSNDGQPIEQRLDRALGGWRPRDPRDAGLVREIVLGVLRHRRRLDMALAPLCSKPLDQLTPDLLEGIRIGLYQLYFLDRVPPHAAIKETVSVFGPGPARMVNAVLREAQRRGPEILEVSAETAPTPLKRAAFEWSLPDWLMEYFAESFGEDDAVQLAQASHQRPTLVIRVNEPAVKRGDVLMRLKESDFPLAGPTDFSPFGLRLGPVGTHGSSSDWSFLREGLGCVQDEASQIVALLMEAKGAERILDFCAAPGGKATLLASQLSRSGVLVAVDRTIPKRRRIQQLAQKMGLTNVWDEQTPAPDEIWPQTGKLAGPPFDGILVDAPCSGLGTLARHPDMKWLKSPDDLERLAELQLSILKRVWPRLRPGGRLIYSTCTLGRRENQGVVESFLAATPDAAVDPVTTERFPFVPPEAITPEGYFQSMPHRLPMDGMFAARLVKRTSLD